MNVNVAKRTAQGLLLLSALLALGIWMFRLVPVVGVPESAAPARLAPASSKESAYRSEASETSRLSSASSTPLSAVNGKDARRYAVLIRKFPAGLGNEGQLALRAGDAKRALEVASELATCQYFQDLRLDFEQRGMQAQLAKLLPGTDSAEQARVDAFCQTGGATAQALKVQLALLAAGQGIPEAVYWVHEEQWDPSGSADRQIGRWALAGQDLLAMGKVLLAAKPELLGLSPDDLNVVRKASAMVLGQPEFASRLGFKGILQTAQESATDRLAGVTGTQAYAQLPAGRASVVKFAELKLSSVDEQRAQAIVDALVSERRRQLAPEGR